jgi:hypothetical protein
VSRGLSVLQIKRVGLEGEKFLHPILGWRQCRLLNDRRRSTFGDQNKPKCRFCCPLQRELESLVREPRRENRGLKRDEGAFSRVPSSLVWVLHGILKSNI